MKITGEMLIGASAVRGTNATLRAFDPARNADLEPSSAAAARRKSRAPANSLKPPSTPTGTPRSKRARSFWRRLRTTSSRSAIR